MEMFKIENLSVTFKEDKVLKDINMILKPGEVHVVTGLSGTGKSTLIKSINGIIPNINQADIKGQIYNNDVGFMDLSISERSRYVCTVFQNPKTQFFATNTTDEIAFGLENRNIPRDEIFNRINKTTEILNTEYLLNKDIFKLSGGEKQLVAITSVAAMDVDIYIFDEPSSSLDLGAIERLKFAIEKLKEMGKIILIAEHRLYFLKDILDYIHVLKDGRMKSFSRDEIGKNFNKEQNLRSLNPINKDQIADDYEIKKLFNHEYNINSNLILKDYKFGYKRNELIFDMNFCLNKNINFIIGDNGVGKTTFIRCLCGLNKGFKGKTEFKGMTIKDTGNTISVVMQDVNYQLFTESVYDEFLTISDDNDIIMKILTEMGLLDAKDRHPQSLSGGEKQRLAIGLAAASEKELVILDEPTSGLCNENMKRTIEYIWNMKKNGKTIIIITHDYEFIKNCGGRVIEFM